MFILLTCADGSPLAIRKDSIVLVYRDNDAVFVVINGIHYDKQVKESVSGIYQKLK